MTDKSGKTVKKAAGLAEQVGAKAARKLKAELAPGALEPRLGDVVSQPSNQTLSLF